MRTLEKRVRFFRRFSPALLRPSSAKQSFNRKDMKEHGGIGRSGDGKAPKGKQEHKGTAGMRATIEMDLFFLRVSAMRSGLPVMRDSGSPVQFSGPVPFNGGLNALHSVLNAIRQCPESGHCPRDSHSLPDCLFCGRHFMPERQEDGKDGPAVAGEYAAFQADGAAVFFDDALADPQAQSGAHVFLG